MLARASQTRNPLAARSQGSSVPPPVEGWDASSPLASMDPKRAIVLDNFFPQQGYIELRRGFLQHCNTSVNYPVKTLMPYNAANSANDKMFAAINTTIYDVTSSTSSATSVTSLTNSALQYVNFSTSAGHFLWVCNGADAPRHYNGLTWATPSLTFSDPTSIINVGVYKRRLFFASAGSLSFHYLPVDSVAGTVSSFNLGAVFDQGGYLMAIGTLSFDGGAGPDDHAVFVSSKGQVAIYAGDDPSDPTAWALVGVYNLPEPIGRRCLTKVAGDLAIITVSGLLPMSKSLIRDREVKDVALSARIYKAMNEAAQAYKNNFGWEMTVYPKGHMGIVNIPVSEGVQQQQYVVNLLSGAWCRFTGQNASTWCVFKERLFFGGNNGRIYEADVYPTDNGTPITADMKTAFNYFNNRGQLKRWTLIQPLIYADGRVTPSILINTDFDDSVPDSIYGTSVLGNTLWDAAVWDVSTWPPETVVSKGWQSVFALGQCAAIRMRVVATSTNTVPITFQANGFNLIYEKGGFL